MAEAQPTKCKVDCPCGWTDVFSASFSGLLIDCPKCGKRHRIPMFGAPRADDEIDMQTMERLLETQQDTSRVSLNFPRLLLYALAFAVAAAVVALLLVRPIMPHAVAVAGGALSWPLAMFVAWMGQKRYAKQAKKRSVQKV